jgi:glycosyltransferase involved in cell wall biosynthesis
LRDITLELIPDDISLEVIGRGKEMLFTRGERLNSQEVLFVNHEASKSGATNVLLYFLKWLRVNSNIPFRILLARGGELESEFRHLAPVSVLDTRFANAARNRKSMSSWAKCFSNNGRCMSDKISLIYLNTIAHSTMLKLFEHSPCPVICHVHELEFWINRIGLKNFQNLQKRTQYYIAVSNAVKENLVRNHGVMADRIAVIHGAIPINSYESREMEEIRFRTRKQLNIPQNSLVIGGVGVLGWRKGSDLFIQLAKKILNRKPNIPIHFIWVGADPTNGEQMFEVEQDAVKLRLQDFVHFVGFKQNPLEYFSIFDIYTLVSREDPFPLAMLESASLGKPLVCFEHSGGGAEFIDRDCGYVVPYLDIEEMANRTLELIRNKELRERFGQNAMHKVKQFHDISISAPKILNIINQYLRK